MGLFNRFRRRVKETVDASDAEGMLAEEGSDEANAALQAREAVQEQSATPQPTPSSDDDWDDPEDDPEPAAEDDWDEPEDDWELPEEEETPAPAPVAKPRRKAPVASKVELRMMRSTTGRQLVEVAQAP
ncbi:MAG: hypothetical protein VYB36_05730, partial [Candidatus Thermoplasmatota archaeon]|nr:hypothetical protein [Candidatus Thermoplasmatota archaeon]